MINPSISEEAGGKEQPHIRIGLLGVTAFTRRFRLGGKSTDIQMLLDKRLILPNEHRSVVDDGGRQLKYFLEGHGIFQLHQRKCILLVHGSPVLTNTHCTFWKVVS